MPPIELQDTDLFLVNRDDVTYKVTAADLDLTGAAPVNPNPDDVTISPDVSGDGTEFNPYMLTSNAVEFGGTVFTNETITIVDQKPGNLVTWTDLNSDRNGTRYNQAVGTIGNDGTFSTKLRFFDGPATENVKTYSATIKLGDSTIYFRWDVNVVAPVTPPILNSVTIVDTGLSETSRFEDESFETTFVLEEGNPVSTKSVAYKVEGKIKSQVSTSEIVATGNESIPGGWNPVTVTQYNWRDMCWGNGRYVAVANGKALTSTNGLAWDEYDMPAIGWEDVIYGGGRYVAVSYGATGDQAAWSADGGVSWNRATTPALNLNCIAYGDGKFVSIQYSGQSVIYSTNGASWSSVSSAMPSSEDWQAFTYGNGTFVAIAANTDKAAYSSTGLAFTAASIPAVARWQDVCYGDGKFVVIGKATDGNGTNVAYSADDGVTWSAASTGIDESWNGITYADGKFVAVAGDTSSGGVCWSVDGINWLEATAQPVGNNWYSVVYGTDKFVAISQSGSQGVMWSTSGTDAYEAQLLTFADDSNLANFAVGDTVTQNSPAGAESSSITETVNQSSTLLSANAPSTQAIGYFVRNDNYFLSGSSPNVYYSTDGSVWTRASGSYYLGNGSLGIHENVVMAPGNSGDGKMYKSTNYGVSFIDTGSTIQSTNVINNCAYGQDAQALDVWLWAGGSTNNSTSALYVATSQGSGAKKMTTGNVSGNNGASLIWPVFFLGTWYIIYRTGYSGPGTQTQKVYYSNNVSYANATSNWSLLTGTNVPTTSCQYMFICNDLLMVVHREGAYADLSWTADGINWNTTELVGSPRKVHFKDGTYYAVFVNSGTGKYGYYFSDDLYNWNLIEVKSRSTYGTDDQWSMNEATGRTVIKGFYNDPNDKASLYNDYLGDEFTSLTFNDVTNFDKLKVGDTVTQDDLAPNDLTEFRYAFTAPVTSAGEFDRRGAYYPSTQTKLLGDMTDSSNSNGVIMDAGSSGASVEMKVGTSVTSLQGSNDLKNWVTVGSVSTSGSTFNGYRYYATQALSSSINGITIVSGVNPQVPSGVIKYIDSANDIIQVRPVDARWAAGQSITGAASTGTGIFRSADIGNLTIKLADSVGYWSPNTDRYALGPVKTLDNTVKYLETNSIRQVTGLAQLPSYYETTNLTDEITFDLPTGTGQTWDQELPEGTTIQAQVFADNIAAGGSRSPESGTVNSLELQPGSSTISDWFSTNLYNVTNPTVAVTNGINLLDAGGLLWVKGRSNDGNIKHCLFDTTRGSSMRLNTNSDSAEDQGNTITWKYNGFDITGYGNASNYAGTESYVAWTFRKAPGFFDICRWTGNEVAGTTVGHNLGSIPGFIIAKKVDSNGVWQTYHKSLGPNKYTSLSAPNTTVTSNSMWNDTNVTETEFTLGSGHDVNESGYNYVGYVFADVPEYIKCASYTGGAGLSLNVGFKTQWFMCKATSAEEDWVILDAKRASTDSGLTTMNQQLSPNKIDAEKGVGSNAVRVTDTALVFPDSPQYDINTPGVQYIYIAIAEPVVASLSQEEFNLTKLMFETNEFRKIKHEQDIVARASELRSNFESRGFTTAEIDQVLGSE